MTTARWALILMALVTSGAASRAQQAPADNGVAQAPRDPVAAPRPKPGKLLLDLLQTMVKPNEQPASPQPMPVDPKGGLAPVTTDPVVVPPPVTVVTPQPRPVTIKADPVKPRPVAIKVDPVRPSAPRPLPPEAVLPSLPEPRAIEAPAPPPAAPEEATPLPPPPIAARANDTPGEGRRAMAWLWLAAALVAVLAGAGSIHLRRMRRVARTKAALSLAPRIDLSGGCAAPPVFALTKPSVAIRARLEERGHG